MRFEQLWHGRVQYFQSHAWLRSLLSAVVRTADATQSLRLPKTLPPNTKSLQK